MIRTVFECNVVYIQLMFRLVAEVLVAQPQHCDKPLTTMTIRRYSVKPFYCNLNRLEDIISRGKITLVVRIAGGTMNVVTIFKDNFLTIYRTRLRTPERALHHHPDSDVR